MYSTQFLPFLIRHLNYCRKLKCEFIDYDPVSKKLVNVATRRRICMFRLQGILTIAYTFTMSLQLSFGSLSVQQKCQGLVFLASYLILQTTRWNYSLDIAPIQVINTFVNFENGVLAEGKKMFNNLVR